MLAAALPAPGRAEVPDPGERGFALAADEVRYERDGDLYEASGNVRVEEGGRTLTADWVVFNATARAGVAAGGVELTDRQGTLVADFTAFDWSGREAFFRDAELDSPRPGFRIAGETIERTGEGRYRIGRGRFTTCRCEPESGRRPWEIEVEEARVDPEGYAVARNLRLEAFGVPVLYLPWLAFPAGTERRTGLLLPTWSSSSRSGTEIELPLFVTLGESAQTTLRPRFVGDRGIKLALDLEYVFGEEGAGEAGVAGLAGDRAVERRGPETPFGDDRWAYWLRHEHPLGRGARLGLDVKRVGDNQYALDFDDVPGLERSRRFLESAGWASLMRRGWYAGLETSVVDDLQSPDDVDRDDFLLQRLADVRFSSLPRKIGRWPLRFALESRYTFFRRLDGSGRIGDRLPVGGRFFDTGADGTFDEREADGSGGYPGGDVHRDNFGSPRPGAVPGSEGDGRFQAGELLADDGQRLDLYPHLSLPLRFGAFETLSELGFRETFYFPDAGSSERRGIGTARFDVRTRLVRDVRLGGRELRHQIEPRLAFAAVSAPSQRRNPLFVPGASVRPKRLIDGDLRLLTRDPGDRVEDARLLQVQLGQRLYDRSPGAGERPVAELRLGAGYDLADSDVRRVFVEGSFRASENFWLTFDAGYDPKRSRFDDLSGGLGWRSGDGSSLLLSYRYLREPGIGFETYRRVADVYGEADPRFRQVRQLGLDSFVRISPRFAFFTNGWVSLERSSETGGEAGLAIRSRCRCWDLLLNWEHGRRPDDTRFGIELVLAGFGRGAGIPGERERRRREERLRGLGF